MSRRKHTRKHQSRAIAPTRSPSAPPERALDASPRLLLPGIEPTASQPATACYRVTVLLNGIWSSLFALAMAQTDGDGESDDLHALDTLVSIAAPRLAQEALERHYRMLRPQYRYWGIHALTATPLPDRDLHEMTVRGEQTPSDVVPALGFASATATQARATVPIVLPFMFWPLVGSFFSAVDNSPAVALATWNRLLEHPEQFTLLQVRVHVRYGTGGDGEPPDRVGLDVADDDSAWQYCQVCRRAFYSDEYRAWDGRRCCPYDCDGVVGRDSTTWKALRRTHPQLPRVPDTWIRYDLTSLEPDDAPDGG